MVEVVELLRGRERRGKGERPGNEEPVMAPQLLHRPVRPAEALPLVAGERLRDEAAPEAGIEVDRGVAGSMEADGQLGILGHAPLGPASHLLERLPPNQRERPDRDRGVALVAGHEHGGEEVAVLPVAQAQVAALLPRAVVVPGLHEAEPRILEEADQALEVVGLDQVVAIDHPEARHLELRLELGERAAVTLEKPVEEMSSGRVGEGLEGRG